MGNLKRFLVVGCNGRFGTIFSEKLAEEGFHVDGLDRGNGSHQVARFENFSCASILEPDELAIDLLAAADCVLLCVPEAIVLDSLSVLTRHVRADSVIVDIASTKTRIEDAVRSSAARVGYLSIHPMFGPLRSFESRNICIVPVCENAKSLDFVDLLRRWKARLVTVTAAAHDRATAYVQAVTHAAILNIALTLRQAGWSFETISALATPVQRTLLALCARMVSADPALYWEIQTGNPFAAAARKDYLKQWNALSDTFERLDHETFEHAFDGLAKYFETDKASLFDLASNVVEIADGGISGSGHGKEDSS
jgi:prephenate dehydrogenase